MNIENRLVSSPELQVPTVKLMRIEEVPSGPFTAYCLHLNNGTCINLPPDALVSVRNLIVGDDLIMTPREDVLDGELRRFEDQTDITVKRSKKRYIPGEVYY
jgi:hypothetical protein